MYLGIINKQGNFTPKIVYHRLNFTTMPRKTLFSSFLIFVLLLSNALLAVANDCYELCFDNQNTSIQLCDLHNDLSTKPQYQYRKGQLYLKLRDGLDINVLYNATNHNSRLLPLVNKYGITSIELAFPRLKTMGNYYRIKFNKPDLTDQLMLELKTTSFVQFSERIPIHRTFLTPNDIHPDQYNVTLTQCPQAWDITIGNNNVLIGMVDDAVRTDHEDLAANIWTNPGEIDGNNIDDDGNGYIDDIHGWDAASNDNDPNPIGADNFSFSHGTHCAGISCAVTDNGIGIAAVSFNATLVPIKTAETGDGSIAAGFEGVEYAIANRVDVISMSWGGGAPAATEQAVFDEAYSLGIICVAAAGNDNVSDPMYPASYNHVISVAAIDENDNKASFSNYGATIDVAAPGVHIWSTVATSTNSYEFYDGTSMACPFVSGLCALMRSYDPNISVDRVEQCIKNNADDIDGINPDFSGQLGAGRVNVYQTMLCVPSEPLAVFTTNFVGTACANTPIQFTDQSGGIAPLTWQWSFPGGTPSSSTIQNPIVTYPSNGTYTATLIVTNNLGDDTISQTIVIAPPTAVFGNDTTIIAGYPAQPTIYLTGTPPWNIIVSNGAGNTPYNNITENPFVLNTFPQQPTTYTITSIQDDNCNGTAGDNMLVNVIGGEDDPNSPAYLVKHVLLGGGCLAVSNVQYTGDPLALGEFTQAPNLNIGFANGVIMATGDIAVANAPNSSGSETNPGGGLGTGGDSDLEDLIGNNPTNDAAVLEFDFVPATDNISFNYVFGSEEYPEYVCSQFNDVFAFFISGPGIVGLQNIAIVPGTANMPVAINSVNVGEAGTFGLFGDCISLSNAEYFVDNEFGNTTQFDGYTVSLAAVKTGLIPCQSYHIKLAIADVFDAAFDSAVFLEAGSFNDGSAVNVSSIGATEGSPEIYEGCNIGQFIFTRTSDTDLSQPYNIDVTWSGTATAGVDYETLPAIVTIPANDTLAFVNVTGIGDGLTEGAESVIALLTDIDCGCTFIPLQAALLILDSPGIDAGATAQICPGGSATLTASGGSNYTWSPATGLNTTTGATVVATPASTTWYTVQGVNNIGCLAVDSVLVFIKSAPYLPNISLDTTVCAGETIEIQLTDINQISNYNYAWLPTTGLNNPNIANPLATINSDIVYTLTVTNSQGCTGTQSVTVNFEQIEVPFSVPDTSICVGDTLSIDAGSGFASYLWSDGSTQSNLSITQAGTYSITVTDANNCPATADVVVSTNPTPQPTITGDLSFIMGQSITLQTDAGMSSYLWNNGTTTPNINVNTEGTYTVTVTNSDGCTASASTTVTEILINEVLIPSAFSPNNDDTNDEFSLFIPLPSIIESSELTVYNRWGEKIFTSANFTEGWDGKYKGFDCEMGTYVYYGNVTLIDGTKKEFKGNVALIR